MEQPQQETSPVDPTVLIEHLRKIGIDLEDCDLNFSEEPLGQTPKKENT